MSNSLLSCHGPVYNELTDDSAKSESIHSEQKTRSFFSRAAMELRRTIVVVSLFVIPLLAIVWDKIPHSWNNLTVALNTSLEDGHFVTWQAPVKEPVAPAPVASDWGQPSDPSFKMPAIPGKNTDSTASRSLSFATQDPSYASTNGMIAQRFDYTQRQDSPLNQGTEMLSEGQLNELKQLGVTQYELTPWGNSGSLWRFSCRVPSIAGHGYEQLFEAVDISPEKPVALVIAKVKTWQMESR